MSLLTVILAIIAVGIFLWVVNAVIPMDSKVKLILNGVVILVLVTWLLKAFGLFQYLEQIRF